MSDTSHMGRDYIWHGIKCAQQCCNKLFRTPGDNGVQSVDSAPISHHQTREVTNSTAALMQYMGQGHARSIRLTGSMAGVSRL